MFTMSEVVDLAVRIEVNGERVYRRAASAVSDPDLRNALVWLADQEAEHAQWFRSLAVAPTVVAEDSPLAELGKTLLGEIMDGRSFSLEGIDFTRLIDARQVLTTSLNFEEDTKTFYELIGAFMDDKAALSHLDTIIAEEAGHIKELTMLIARLDAATRAPALMAD
ncbi:MAG: ferritin family protein [Pseudomonadota bacterium]